MAVRQIVVSDISGADLAEGEHARVVVEHPDFGTTLELDVSTSEADRLQDSTLRLVNFTIYAPNRPPRRAVIETKTLDRLFDGVDFDAVLEGARKADRPRATSTAAARPARPVSVKVDYGSPDYAGVLHRGRITEREAELVRADLEQANANRAREGQAPIDPSDPKEKRRYGF